MKRLSFIFLPLLLIVGCAIFFSFFHISDKKINVKVLFINQIRGVECCQKGSYDFTKHQLELFKKYDMPATFVLRYDALDNNQFITLFKSYINSRFDYGIFFEITPRLAKDAGVVYKGSEERWYRPQYAYFVGYSQEERKKLIDTAMARFKQRFGFYPKTTSGWMIDTYSAEYISSTYGVKTHEITREQWGTDGYALYGGSILSAYIPSKKWLFMPAQSKNDSFPLRIIRQTISDPVRNYGDLTSGYTSQPNDYSRAKSFDYFKHLLGQVENYSQPIAVLGLENSLDKRYQDIYKKQIEYAVKVIDKKNIILSKEMGTISEQNYIFGTDYENKNYSAYWIQTLGYRARIILKNNYIQLTDLRIYDELMDDPYYATASGEKTAYWETPYIFDSSKNGVHKTINTFSTKIGELFHFFGNEDWIRERINPVVNEQFLQDVNGIIFPQIKKNTSPSITEKDGTIMLRYTQQNGKEIFFSFYKDHFFVKGVKKNEYEIKGSIGKNTELLQEKKNDGMFFTPLLIHGESVKNIITSLSSENDVQVQRSEISIIYSASQNLIGRNPVRLVIISKDSGGKPVRIKNMQIAHTKGFFDSVKVYETEGHLGEFDGMYYIDIEQKAAGTYVPILTHDSQQIELHPVSFVFDCKKDLTSCLLNPQKLIDYMKVRIGDVINRR